MKEQCQKVKMQRWPSSSLKATTKFGKDCPYAHHPMELQFPESLNMRIKATEQKSKKQAPENKFGYGFVGPLYHCGGCSRCGLCKYKLKAKEVLEKSKVKCKIDEEKIMEKKKETDKNVDLFTKKFGMLKKASVLFFYGRVNDSFDEIAKAAQIVKDQNEANKENELNLQKRW